MTSKHKSVDLSKAVRLWKFWYSAKHAEHLASMDILPLSVVINGQRVQYTECSSEGNSAPTAPFDDFVLLGEGDSHTIQGGGNIYGTGI